MDRLIGLVALLLFVCLLMPTLAAYAIKTVPVLVSLLLFLGVVRLLLPPRSRRRS
jgi:hypothetical protein